MIGWLTYLLLFFVMMLSFWFCRWGRRVPRHLTDRQFVISLCLMTASVFLIALLLRSYLTALVGGLALVYFIEPVSAFFDNLTLKLFGSHS